MQRLVDLRVQPVDDLGGSARGREVAEPARNLVVRHAGFDHRGHLRNRRQAPLAGHRERPQPPRPDRWEILGGAAEKKVHFAREHGGVRRCRALVRHVGELESHGEREQHRGKMLRAAGAVRGIGEPARVRARGGDEVLHRAIAACRVDDQHVRLVRDLHHRREVAHRVVRQLIVQARVDAVRADAAQHDGVAVGRRFRSELGADDAVGAGAILHHHRLAERAAELRADLAPDHVVVAAGGIRHDRADRLRRIALCGRHRAPQKQEKQFHETPAVSLPRARAESRRHATRPASFACSRSLPWYMCSSTRLSWPT